MINQRLFQMLANCCAISLTVALSPSTLNADPGSAEDRAALFDYVLTATLERTAFSPYKIDNIGPTPYSSIEELVRTESLKYREEMIGADSDEALFFALHKISNVRWDSHLHVTPVDGGLVLDRYQPGIGGKIEESTPHAPVKFKPDYGDPDRYLLFVSDFSQDIAEISDDLSPDIGDVLTAVNGQPVDEYLARLKQYHGKSSLESLWWDLAYSLPLKTWFVHPSMYDGDSIALALRKSSGEVYELRLPYERYDSIDWTGYDDLYTDITRAEYMAARDNYAEIEEEFNAWKYPGYERLFSTPSYDCYVNEEEQAFLLKWNLFRSSVMDDVQRFIDYAQANDQLHYAVIWDGLRTRGGNFAVWMLQRLQPKPFKTTFGNLRISDITQALADNLREDALNGIDGQGRQSAVPPARKILQPDNGQFLLNWLDNDLAKGISAGQAYSNNVPFKNYYLPTYSDGFVYPAEIHFTGPLILFVGPAGCSQVDQFVSMVVDNGLGYSIGMKAGGCSNTWEWNEVLRFPNSGKPVVNYMWTAGHTIRPNGEVMEGNSSEVDVYLPLTRHNYLEYYNLLFDETYRYIDARSSATE